MCVYVRACSAGKGMCRRSSRETEAEAAWLPPPSFPQVIRFPGSCLITPVQGLHSTQDPARSPTPSSLHPAAVCAVSSSGKEGKEGNIHNGHSSFALKVSSRDMACSELRDNGSYKRRVVLKFI